MTDRERIEMRVRELEKAIRLLLLVVPTQSPAAINAIAVLAGVLAVPECQHDWRSARWTDGMLVADGQLHCEKCGAKKPNMVFWSEPMDPTKW